MLKSQAIEILGGTAVLAAREIGITPQAVGQWPERLPKSIRDRVHAALWRRVQSALTGPAAQAAAASEGAALPAAGDDTINHGFHDAGSVFPNASEPFATVRKG